MPQMRKSSPAARRPGSEAMLNLARRRFWFADGDGKNEEQPASADGKYKPTDLESAQKIIAALEKRLAERDGTISGLNDRLTAIEQANKAKLEQEGNFKELAAQRAAEIEALKPSAARAAELDKLIRDLNEARIKQVPETMRSIVPTDYPPEKLQAWLVANEPLLKSVPPPDFDAGKGTSGQGKSTATALSAEELAMAKLVGVPPEDFAKQKKILSKE